MKTITYKFMFLATALTFAACSSDDVLDSEQPLTPANTGENITFASTIGDQLEILSTENLDGEQNAQTRVILDKDNKLTSWETSDKISISDGTLMHIYQPSSSGANAEFEPKTGKSGFSTGQAGTFYAFYPADAVLGWNGTTVSTMIYTEQNYTENMAYDANVDNSGVMGPYMVATATTTDGGSKASFTFGHICSVIDVDLSTFDGGEVESVALYANSQVSVAGSLKLNIDTKAATISGNDGAGYSASLQSEVVRVSQINATQPTVRFYVMPVKQTAGFTITVRCSDGKYYTKSSSTSVGGDDLNDYITTQSGITGGTLCKPYYKKYKFGTKSSARTQNWMAMIPGNIKFNHLSLPGAHDAGTDTGSAGSTSAAKCQSYSIENLLTNGCRALDLRPGSSSTDLTLQHGITATNVTLDGALGYVKTFLTNNPTETVFVLIHEENANSHSTNWSNRIQNCLAGYSDYIQSYGWQGNLNPCRGKMVIIFRDEFRDGSTNKDRGCGRVGWGSSFNDKAIFTGSYVSSNDWGTAKGTLRYQDDYETNSANTKLNSLTTMLNDHIAANETNEGYTFVNNTNIAYSTNSVSTYATNVNNAILNSSTFTTHTGRFGIMMTDFLFSSTNKGDQMFELIHKQNYKYVYKNRTRCTTASGTDTGVDITSSEFANDGTVYAKQQNF